MLRQTSIPDIRQGKISRKDGYLVACMAFYPRGLSKTRIDEFRNNLAPDRELFADWKASEEKAGHEQAFVTSNYEDRFKISPEGKESLRRLVDLSRKQDVFLACQCEIGERCHREMLLLTAQAWFNADIGEIFKCYPRYMERLAQK